MADFNNRNKVTIKEKTSVFSSKLFIGISLFGLGIFLVMIALGNFVYKDYFSFAENDSVLLTTKKRGISKDPLITLVSLKPTINETDPKLGLENAPVTIVEFGDFECPHCAVMNGVLAEVLQVYPKQVQLVWKDLPFPDIHKNSYEAALAARCAQQQGKFWEMQELLLANNTVLNQENYNLWAQQLSLNLDDFKQCLKTKKTAALVDDGIKQAENLQIEATPHFYINDQEISGIANLNDFIRLIKIELNLKNSTSL